jgi:hypothetical protein
MSDRLVTVATFALDGEAQLARNLLEAEGIPAALGGEMSAALIPGQIRLEVRADDAPRAVALLAAVSLDKDWERQAARGVWTCSVCGDATAEGQAVCSTCATPRDAIRTADHREDIRPLRPAPRAVEEGIQAPVGLTPAPRPAERPHVAAPRNGSLTCYLVLLPALLAAAIFLGLLVVSLICFALTSGR